MTAQLEPRFEELSREESEQVLLGNFVGRLAFSFRDSVDIQPLSYVYDAGWIYFRTEPGAKLATLQHHKWCAFEVDEIEGPFEWRSVVARGGVYVLDPTPGLKEEAAYQHAVAQLRRLMPDALTDADPVPFRDVVLRMYIDELHGRRATVGDSPTRE
jgi:uncharacterized protein